MTKRSKPPKKRDISPSPPELRGQRSGENHFSRLRPLVVVGLIAAVYLFRIDRPPLWCDEAETGIEARSILRCGLPVAYDGRNLSLYESGIQVNKNFVYKEVPWVQYGLGALSIAIFGDNAAGLRILFALVGVAAFFPIYAVLKKRVAHPDIVAAMALLAPQIVLFQRNARYFSILILIYSLLVWHLSSDVKNSKGRYAIAVLIFLFFFHTHPFVALCSSVSLLLYCLLFSRKSLLMYAISSIAGFVSWFVWHELLGPSLSDMGLLGSILSLIRDNFGFYIQYVWQSFLLLLVDMDAANCLPLLFWALISGSLIYRAIYRARKAVANRISDPLPIFVFLNIVVQMVATSAILGHVQEYGYTNTHLPLSYLRFMPHLLVFAMLSGFIILESIIPDKRLCLLSCAIVIVFNPFTLSYWASPFARSVPVSWAAPVYA